MIEIKEDTILTCDQMRQFNVQTGEYQFMDEEGCYTGVLDFRAYGNSRKMRLFFTLDDGRKIISLVFWWDKDYLGFKNIPNGTYLCLHYKVDDNGVLNLKSYDIIE